MSMDAIKANVTAQKALLPQLFNGLMRDLQSYKQSRETPSVVRAVFLELGIQSETLSSKRLTIVNQVISDLSDYEISYVGKKTPSNMERIGSAEVFAVYSRIAAILFTALLNNDDKTADFNSQHPDRTFPAGSGVLSAILARHKDKVTPPKEVLNSYLLSQTGSKAVRTEVQSLADNFLTVFNLR